MLDTSLLEQLKQVFSALEHQITLKINDHAELKEMIQSLATSHPLLGVEVESHGADSPLLSLEYNNQSTGIVFKAVPGGHEFSSLVLSILNADGKGKLPDDGMKARIRRLKKGASIRTYMSLECENCPEVVQALNQVVLIHGGLVHEIIDGALFVEETKMLNIQAVPSVFVGDKLVSVGRASLGELLSKLEETLGTDENSVGVVENDKTVYDVLVMGGGPAGVSAAIYSARKGMKTLLVSDNLGGQLKETLGIENMIGTVRTEGARLAQDLVLHLKAYPVKVLEHRRIKKVDNGDVKQVHTDGGEVFQSKNIIVATGAKWKELNVPGEKEYLGRGVAFCPHCDGPFYKGKKVAVVGGGNSGVEAALDLSNIASHVTLIEYANELKADAVLVEQVKLKSNIDVMTASQTLSIKGNGETVTGIELKHRTSQETNWVPLDGVFVQIGLSPNSACVKGLVETNAYGEIIVDGKGQTNVPGIYAAGDVTQGSFKQIVIAMGSGANTALGLFEHFLKAS